MSFLTLGDPGVKYMKIDPENFSNKQEEHVYKSFQQSRQELKNRFPQVKQVDEVEGIDQAPGFGKVKISSETQGAKETVVMEYNAETGKVRFMNIDLENDNQGDKILGNVDYRSEPDGSEKIRSKVRIYTENQLMNDVDLLFTLEPDGILIYENNSRLINIEE